MKKNIDPDIKYHDKVISIIIDALGPELHDTYVEIRDYLGIVKPIVTPTGLPEHLTEYKKKKLAIPKRDWERVGRALGNHGCEFIDYTYGLDYNDRVIIIVAAAAWRDRSRYCFSPIGTIVYAVAYDRFSLCAGNIQNDLIYTVKKMREGDIVIDKDRDIALLHSTRDRTVTLAESPDKEDIEKFIQNFGIVDTFDRVVWYQKSKSRTMISSTSRIPYGCEILGGSVYRKL